MKVVVFLMFIQIRPGLTVVLVWITPKPPSIHRWGPFLD